ncbi:MAG: hypothetical protein IKU88_07745 [Alistipes sp.]|nr:hypothetical protein [Alistipes sp.]MBR5811817.1 hypothetical protein [Alistipes sp.]
MGTLLYKLQVVKRWLKSYISPAFILLFCASFVFWYILKLGNTYTTEYNILVNVDGQTLRIPSVVEGVGTNLLGYRNYTRKEIKLRLNDLKYRREKVVGEMPGDSLSVYVLDPQSVQNAISVRFSDIKVVSLGDIPPLMATDSIDVAAEEQAARSSIVAKIVKLLKRDKGSAAATNVDSI